MKYNLLEYWSIFIYLNVVIVLWGWSSCDLINGVQWGYVNVVILHLHPLKHKESAMKLVTVPVVLKKLKKLKKTV